MSLPPAGNAQWMPLTWYQLSMPVTRWQMQAWAVPSNLQLYPAP